MTGLICAAGVTLLWIWSLLGRQAYRSNAAGRLFERRQSAATEPFALLLVLTPLAANAPNKLLSAASGVVAALIYVRYVALDPFRTGFWHHRRIRPLGVGAAVVAGIGFALYGPSPALTPLAFAALVFNRYLRLTMALTAQQFVDNEAQRQKLLAHHAVLDIARKPAPRAPLQSIDDKVSKAG